MAEANLVERIEKAVRALYPKAFVLKISDR